MKKFVKKALSAFLAIALLGGSSVSLTKNDSCTDHDHSITVSAATRCGGNHKWKLVDSAIIGGKVCNKYKCQNQGCSAINYIPVKY